MSSAPSQQKTLWQELCAAVRLISRLIVVCASVSAEKLTFCKCVSDVNVLKRNIGHSAGLKSYIRIRVSRSRLLVCQDKLIVNYAWVIRDDRGSYTCQWSVNRTTTSAGTGTMNVLSMYHLTSLQLFITFMSQLQVHHYTLCCYQINVPRV